MNDAVPFHELPLPGLREDNPRDFLAALGLLRLVDMVWPESGAALSWSRDSSAPVLSAENPLPAKWCETLVEAVKNLEAHPEKPLTHGDIIKTEYANYRAAVKGALHFAETDQRLCSLPLMLYACYSSQLEEEGERIEPSGFSFGNGQSGKKLLLDVMQLIQSLDPEIFLKTLRGGATPVAAKSLRWNPSEFRPAAYRSHDPGSKLKGDEGKDHPALNILAFFGLTFFPAVPTKRGGRTCGMHDDKRERYFQWPIWITPLLPEEVSTLVCAQSAGMIAPCGVERVWRARRFSSDKSLYFAAAEFVR